MEFLTSGQKVKKLRKLLNMKQHDLQGKNVTRGLISLIEVDKRGVSSETSHVLATKFIEKATKIGIEIKIDDEYFKRTPVEDAERYCIEKFRKNPSLVELNLILDISEKFSLESIQAEAHKLLGDIFYQKSYYGYSFEHYLSSVTISIKLQLMSTLSYLYNRMGICKTNMLMYLESLFYLNKAYYYSSLYNDLSTKMKVVYNMGRSYKKLERYDEAIKYLNEYDSICDKKGDFTSYAYGKILISNCYRRKNMFNKAISIYDELINQCSGKHNDILGYIYNNLGDIYSELNNFDTSLNYFEMAERIRIDIDKNNLPYTYIDKARVYLKMENFTEAKDIVNMSLDHIKQNPNMEVEVSAYYILAEIYSYKQDFESVKRVHLHLVELLNVKEKKSELIKIYSKLAEIYMNEHDYTMSKKYLEMIRNT
ncbi:tetratricopeptide repeat protein [Candidatus Clostridium stratigraminis]|uniref:Tetratricopeptide repeat protein n=1 Tax=Candidatus Clostridium stratigraminis TaxID=3381661 RepID=A0ABW8T584_9CLOT